MYSINHDILNFDDYRAYLKTAVQDLRDQGLFSYRKFSELVGFGSPNFLLLIIQGERNISDDSAVKIGEAFGLKQLRLQFFKELVKFNQSQNPSERFLHSQNLLKFKAKLNTHFIEHDHAEYFKKWIHATIRELMLIDSKITISDIARRLKPEVTISEVKKSVDLLLNLDLVHQVDGQWLINKKSLSTGNQIVTATAFNYHQQMIDLGQQALDRFHKENRSITGTTVSLSWENFRSVTEKINEIRSEILALSEIDQNKDEVFQFNFQGFPLTLKKDVL